MMDGTNAATQTDAMTTTLAPRDLRPRHRWLLACLAAINAPAAWIGMLGLLGGGLSLGPVVTERLPFDSPEVAGVALGALIAVPSTALAAMAFRGDPRSAPLAVRVGGMLILWIVVQLLVIRSFSLFQPICVASGAWLMVLGRRSRPATR
jgi:hypothetical protein